jgi:hypothetical protein
MRWYRLRMQVQHSVQIQLSGSAVVTVNKLPTATISGTATVCQNAGTPTITFTGANATAPYTFTYSINGVTQSAIVSSANTATVAAPTGTAGIFTYALISVKDASATLCTNTVSGSVTVTVNALPNVTAGSNSPVAAYGTLNLSASGANTYAWTGPNTYSTTGATPSITNVSGANGGIYTVVGKTTATGCTNTATVNVVVNFVAGTGLSFDGANDYVSLTAPKVASLNTFTVEAWVKPTAASGTIYCEGLSSSLNPMFSLIHTPNGNSGFEIVLRNTSNVGFVAGTTNGTLVMNQWSHVVFVRTSATTAQLYINGLLTDSFTFTDPGFIQVDVANLGVRQRSNKEYYFTGSMDEVRIWNRALCQAEIQNNKDCELNTAGQTGLLSLYHFNQGFAGGDNNTTPVNTLTDGAGNNNGTLNLFNLTGNTSNWTNGIASGNLCTTFVPPTAQQSQVLQLFVPEQQPTCLMHNKWRNMEQQQYYCSHSKRNRCSSRRVCRNN